MGAEVISNLSIFQETCQAINNNAALVKDSCARSLSDARRKLDETQEELANSNRLLQEAIAEEQRRLLIMQECEAEVQAAAAGLPETAAWYADAQRRLAIAIEEYERAVAHRILMEQRVALAEQCVSIATEMEATLVAKYNYGQSQIDHLSSVGINRLNSADNATSSYINEALETSRANVSSGENTKPKGKNKVYCENLGQEVVCVGSVPGQDEAQEGRPFAGQSGKNLDVILSNLKYKGEPLSREKVSIDNAWTTPLWQGEHGRTEASLTEICSDANLSRLQDEIGKNTKVVIAFGDNAYASVNTMKQKYGLNFNVIKASHPSFSHINRTYSSSAASAELRTADRLRQMSNEIKAASGGMFS